jgi:hypothetical protein
MVIKAELLEVNGKPEDKGHLCPHCKPKGKCEGTAKLVKELGDPPTKKVVCEIPDEKCDIL